MKTHLCARGLANPVGLHGLDAIGPAIELIQILEQLVRVLGDLKEPLLQQLALHLRPRAPGAALAVHLLIGEHGLVNRVPVHRRFLLVGQARLKELQENPLGPAVVVGQAGRHLAVPIVGEAQRAQLVPHLVNVFERPVRRGNAPLNRCVLRRQAKGIPAHGVQHAEALHPTHTGDHIGDGVVAHVAHVQVAGGVGKHGQGIVFRLIRFLGGLIQTLLSPSLLPLFLDVGWVITRLHVTCSRWITEQFLSR